MRTIWKFPFQVAGSFTVDMPADAEILAVQLQGVVPCMWALVDTDLPVMTETFLIVGTGHRAPDEGAVHVGTFQQGPFVWHVFQR